MNDWGYDQQTSSVFNSSQAWINKRLLILVVCALMVVFGGYLCASYFGSSSEPEAAAVASKAANEVQPDADKSKGAAETVNAASTVEPVSVRDDLFSGPMALRGIIFDSKNSLALIEAGDTSYVASKGMPIEEQWVVKEIKADEVVLESQSEKLRLRFHGRAQLESLTGDEKGDRE